MVAKVKLPKDMNKITTFAKQKTLQTFLQTFFFVKKMAIKAIFEKNIEPKNNLCKRTFAIANVDCFIVSFQLLLETLIKICSILCKNVYKIFIGYILFYLRKIYICNIYMFFANVIIGCCSFNDKNYQLKI